MVDNQYVVTISHQLGSGGAYLGQHLSDRLGIPFIDREILKKVADQLNLAVSVLEHREERLSSVWHSLARLAALSTDPTECLSLNNYFPTDKEFFELESKYIGQIGEKSSAIFIGRCGRYILRDHPRHIDLLIHAEMPARVQRVQQLYCLPMDEAKKLIETNDRERAAYVKTFTHQDWLDARFYDLCLNSSTLGLEKTVDLALACVMERIQAGR